MSGFRLRTQFEEQPGPRGAPVAIDGSDLDIHRCRRLLEHQPAEVSKFDDLGLLRVEGFETCHGLVEREHIDSVLGALFVRQVS